MFLKRFSVLIAVAVILILPAGCGRDDAHDTLLEPQLAKPPKPPKPPKPAEESYELLEYYVYQVEGEDGTVQDWVHVVGKGNVKFLNLNAVQDFHFNGTADNWYTPHYEYYTGPPPRVEVEPGPDGVFHMDVPWDGAREVDGETGEVLEYFKDFPTSKIGDTGADPFSFYMYYLSNDPQAPALDSFRPQGIVLGGQETFQTEMSAAEVGEAWHGFETGEMVYSFARFKGDVPVGEVFLTTVDMDLNSVTCDISKTVERINKEKVTTWYATVSADIEVATGSLGVNALSPGLWMELHLVDVTNPSEWVFSDRATISRDGTEVTVAGTFTRRFEGPRDEITVLFAVDYIFPTWYPAGSGGFVYNPLSNSTSFETIGHEATQVGDHGAIAYTLSKTVTCK